MELRVCAAFVSLFVGIFILFEGVTPAPENFLDWSMIALGAALMLGYPVLLGRRFERWIKRSISWVFSPVMLGIGLVVIYQTLMEPFDPVTKLLFTSFGAGLCLVSLAALVKSKT